MSWLRSNEVMDGPSFAGGRAPLPKSGADESVASAVSLVVSASTDVAVVVNVVLLRAALIRSLKEDSGSLITCTAWTTQRPEARSPPPQIELRQRREPAGRARLGAYAPGASPPAAGQYLVRS